ncbi:hypothetical protein TELCIR_23110 [Teladorsagia circumcincta]|uniref:Uncharacterized protein n=1 Tax=Teladorsagia circumcincta TaxID=45464 RepID=A0A2G9TD90_TELCI|nr:hypothetical protein TELCIR_23110 [Teladorsagia circumcincta]
MGEHQSDIRHEGSVVPQVGSSSCTCTQSSVYPATNACWTLLDVRKCAQREQNGCGSRTKFASSPFHSTTTDNVMIPPFIDKLAIEHKGHQAVNT